MDTDTTQKCSARKPSCDQCSKRNDSCVYDTARPATRVQKLEAKLGKQLVYTVSQGLLIT